MSKELTAEPPWASGPGEILQHGLSLLRKDSDVKRRPAMLSIDNAVELMIKTYLGLISRSTAEEIEGLRMVRNQVVHGIGERRAVLRREMVERVRAITQELEKGLSKAD